MLADQLQSDLTEAMRARDELRTATLRLALAAVKEAAVAGREARALSDADVQKVLAAEAKRRTEAAEEYARAGRADRAERELAERAVLAAYLPQQLGEAELAALVGRVLAAGGFEGPKALGAAMRAVQAEVAGRADGRLVADLVKRALAG